MIYSPVTGNIWHSMRQGLIKIQFNDKNNYDFSIQTFSSKWNSFVMYEITHLRKCKKLKISQNTPEMSNKISNPLYYIQKKFLVRKYFFVKQTTIFIHCIYKPTLFNNVLNFFCKVLCSHDGTLTLFYPGYFYTLFYPGGGGQICPPPLPNSWQR